MVSDMTFNHLLLLLNDVPLRAIHVYFRRRSILDASPDAVHPSMLMPRSSSSAFKSCRGLFGFLTFWPLSMSALDRKPSFCRFVLPGGRITDRFPLPVFSLGGEEWADSADMSTKRMSNVRCGIWKLTIIFLIIWVCDNTPLSCSDFWYDFALPHFSTFNPVSSSWIAVHPQCSPSAVISDYDDDLKCTGLTAPHRSPFCTHPRGLFFRRSRAPRLQEQDICQLYDW